MLLVFWRKLVALSTVIGDIESGLTADYLVQSQRAERIKTAKIEAYSLRTPLGSR